MRRAARVDAIRKRLDFNRVDVAINRNQDIRLVPRRGIISIDAQEERELVRVPNRENVGGVKAEALWDIFKVEANFNSERVIWIKPFHHFAELANNGIGRQHDLLPGIRPADVPGLFHENVFHVKVVQRLKVLALVLGEGESVGGEVVLAGLVVFAGEFGIVFFDF